MFKISLYLTFLLAFNYFYDVASVSYNTFLNKPPHLLQTTNSNYDGYNSQQSASNNYPPFQPNLQGNSNYPQLYRYYYNQPYQPTKLWSGPPIVVEDDIRQQEKQQSSTNIPSTFYQQHSNSRNSKLLQYLHMNSIAQLPPTGYNSQPTARTTQYHYNNHKNNNMVYPLAGIPQSQHTPPQYIGSWNNQQQPPILEEKNPQQFYATNSNSPYNGISNDLTLLGKDFMPDYAEHFKRYLENNPNRIKPIYEY